MGNILWKHYINSNGITRFFREDADSNYWFEYSHKSGDMYYVNLDERWAAKEIRSQQSDMNIPWCHIYSSVWFWMEAAQPYGLVNSAGYAINFGFVLKLMQQEQITAYTDTLSIWSFDVLYMIYLYQRKCRFVLRWNRRNWFIGYIKLDDLGTVIDQLRLTASFSQILVTRMVCNYRIFWWFIRHHFFMERSNENKNRYGISFSLGLLWIIFIIKHPIPEIDWAPMRIGIVTLVRTRISGRGIRISIRKIFRPMVTCKWHSVIHNETVCMVIHRVEGSSIFFFITEYSPAAPAFSFPSLGMLIITDNFCQLNDSRIQREGSFYDVNGNELSDSMDIGIGPNYCNGPRTIL